MGFCPNCGHRLAPTGEFDLTPDDYAYEPDRSAIEMIKATGALPFLVRNLALPRLEKDLSSKFLAQAHRISSSSRIGALVRKIGITLSIDTIPDVLVIEHAQPNAFTFGREEHASLVLYSSILSSLTEHELSALLAHELTHVKSGHMLYHTVAEALGSGIGLSASLLGLDIVTVPVRLALLSWHRESEVTADRGSLLAVNDVDVIKSLMTKLATWPSRGAFSHRHPEIEGEKASMLESATELFSTHPLHVNRFRLLKEFSESQQFLKARQKIETRLSLLRALIPVCRFCGARKAIEDLFCPTCERCQT